ncbi:MAG: FxSxx-COOH system tetratricopeptide repeat protein [Streptosporangiaceae bacterium]|jgi:tetratricopeptide (TPR) repeat protein
MTVPDSPSSRRQVPKVWGQVPQRNRNFTGREEILAELWLGQEQPTGNRVTAVVPSDPLPRALQGLGGVGKTAVAIEYAHRHQADYDLVWWIRADQLPLIRSSLAALAERLGLEAAGASGIEAAAAAVLEALRRGEPYSRWLLIFDNADEPDELLGIIPQGPGDVLITSRNNRWRSRFDTVQLDVFARAESQEFLMKRAPKELSESDADRVAHKLGDLPLALEQAAAVQAEAGMPVDEYLRLIDEHVTQIMAEGKSVEYPMSMTAAWQVTVATLNDRLPEALKLLRCCAFFGPDPIPRDVFRRGTKATKTRIGELIEDPIQLARAVRELGRFALVKIDKRTLSVHRLIQALLRDELDSGEQADYRHEVHMILAAAAPATPDDSNLWPLYAELVAHVSNPETQLAQCREPAVRAFALDVVRYLFLSGDLASSRAFADQFITQWSEDSGPEHPTVLDAKRHLGNALRQLGRYREVYDLTEETLGQSQRILGEENPLTLVLRNAFGGDMRARGDFFEALEHDEESQQLQATVFGEESPQLFRVLNNLASDYGRTCQYDKARRLFQNLYNAMSKARSGVSAPEMLSTWTGLAWVVRCSGSYAEARDVSEDAREYGIEKLRPEHYATLRSSISLSIALRLTGAANDQALEIAEETYLLCQQARGDRHPDTLAAAVNLTNILRNVDRIDEALALSEQMAARYPQVFGPDHPYVYGCIGNHALLLRLKRRSSEARRLNERALAGLDDRLTRDHDYTLTVAMNLASDLAELGETAKATALGEDTLGRLRRVLGDDHPITIACATNLAIDLRRAGAEEEADKLAAEVTSRYADTLGSDHPDAVAAAAGQRINIDFDPPFF